MSLKNIFCLTIFLSVFSANARNVILEFKGAYFLPTGCEFKNIYNGGSALFGPELTVQFCNERNWYAFASFDYLQKKGRSVGLCDLTKVKLIPLALGVKYLKPTCNNCLDVYAGLGFEAINVKTTNCSPFVVSKDSRWGFGGIAKVGAYYHLPCNFLIDIFIDYSFAKAGSDDCGCECLPGIESRKANVSGAIFGIGIGYNF